MRFDSQGRLVSPAGVVAAPTQPDEAEGGPPSEPEAESVEE